MLKAPLEQFQILSILSIKICNLDFSITNFLLINLIVLLGGFAFTLAFSFFTGNGDLKNFYYFFVPNSWQKSTEIMSEVTAQLINDTILTDNKKYFPIISVFF